MSYTINSLIERLQAIKNIHGDCPIVDSEFFNVVKVEFGQAKHLVTENACKEWDIEPTQVFVRIVSDK